MTKLERQNIKVFNALRYRTWYSAPELAGLTGLTLSAVKASLTTWWFRGMLLERCRIDGYVYDRVYAKYMEDD